MKPSAAYSEQSIKVLKGLEPVKQRPGMYTRTDHPLHIVQEVLDNAVDEVLAGFAKEIAVTLWGDDSISIEDDGRGIPFGIHPEENISVMELVFTRLHVGGKFDKGQGGAYNFSGGLHGVGVSVTNALSRRLEIRSHRDGQVASLIFGDGDIIEPLSIKKQTPRKQGSFVRIWPNSKYFESAQIPMTELMHLLRSKAVLMPGVRVSWFNQKNDTHQTWLYQEGLKTYLLQNLNEEALISLFDGQGFASENQDQWTVGEGVAWCLAFTENGTPIRESYVNLIPTPAGGTHENGLKEGVFLALKNFIDLHALAAKGLKILPEDVFSRTNFILNTKILDPQFQGQTKDRLNSRDAVRLVSGFVKPAFEIWLNQNVDEGKKLADCVIKWAQARQKSSQKIERKKSSGVAVLPGKLTDCESKDIRYNEIFLVEGDSAGGSAKMGRNKELQAILPLRGKVLNTWELEKEKLFSNHEIHDIAVALGVDPHGLHENPDLTQLRYGKVCILSDADVDGSHIQVLLLSLFFKHFPKLIEKGHIYVARPPLYRVDAPARGKKPASKTYALDDQELKIILDKMKKEGVKEGAWSISRFKGLGEMNAEQLWDTTLNPDTRRLWLVQLGIDTWQETDALMMQLMGKGEAAARRALMDLHGDQVIIDV